MYKKYEVPTEKMVKFFYEECKLFVKEQIELKGDYLPAPDVFIGEAFIYVTDKMLKSEDLDIKIEFSRFLMFSGFKDLASKLGQFVKECGLV